MVCLFQQCKLTSLVVVRWERERSFSCSQRPSLSRSQRHSLVLVLYRLSFPFPAQSQFATLPIPKNSPKLSLELTMQRGLVCNNTKVLPRRPGFQEAFPTSCPATLAQSRLHPVAALSLSHFLSLPLFRDSLSGQCKGAEGVLLDQLVEVKQPLSQLSLLRLTFPGLRSRAREPFARHIDHLILQQ